MNIELLTKEDLAEIKSLLNEALPYLKSNSKQELKWVRGKDVESILNISNTKLQSLRQSGKLTYTKFDNLYYYDLESINAELERNQVKCRECV